jgi:hypothetical protein
MVLIILLLFVIGGILVGISFLRTQSEQVEQEAALDVTPLPSATNTPRPTNTPVVVELDTVRLSVTVPPTFTPTDTPTPTVTFTPSPTPFPLTDFNVYYTGRTSQFAVAALYQMNGDGSNEQMVVENISDITHNATGEFIAFARSVTYPPDSSNPEEITITEIFFGPANDPAAATQITNVRTHNAHSPTISPDGSQIVYVSDQDGDDELWILDISTGQSTRLMTNDGIDRDPHWSPDGSRIVFASDRDSPNSTEIFVLNLNDQSVTQLTDVPGSSYAPRWSPDGSRIAYLNDRGGDSDVYIMDADGQRPFVLTFDDGPAEDRDPDFTPDGRYVAFISNRLDNRFQIYLVNQRGDELIRVTSNDRDVESISFRPEARFLVSN